MVQKLFPSVVQLLESNQLAQIDKQIETAADSNSFRQVAAESVAQFEDSCPSTFSIENVSMIASAYSSWRIGQHRDRGTAQHASPIPHLPPSRADHFGQFQDSLAEKCSAIGVPANFSPSRREKSNSELRGR